MLHWMKFDILVCNFCQKAMIGLDAWTILLKISGKTISVIRSPTKDVYSIILMLTKNNKGNPKIDATSVTTLFVFAGFCNMKMTETSIVPASRYNPLSRIMITAENKSIAG